jgi:hypothetical protein
MSVGKKKVKRKVKKPTAKHGVHTMSDVVNPQITDSVTSTNLKNLGENPTMHNTLALQNAINVQNISNQNVVSHQNRMNILAETAVASAIRSVATTPQEEASAEQPGQIQALLAAISSGQMSAKVAQSTPPQTGDLSATIAQLSAAVAAAQQVIKGAQTTPPVTAS